MDVADLILIVCVLAVAAGVGWIFPPAGLIAAGVLGGGCVLAYERGSA